MRQTGVLRRSRRARIGDVPHGRPTRRLAWLFVTVGMLLGSALSAGVAQAATGGEYTISGLPSGSYKVGFFAGGEGGNYLSQFYNGKASLEAADPFAVTAPSATSGINATLQTGGQIAGKVTAAGGGALPKVEACAEQTSGEHLFTCGTTNASGEYTIAGLQSGSYVVIFFALEAGFLIQFYNGKATFKEAEPVSVTAPNTTSGINAVMQTVLTEPRGQIKGTVTNASSEGLEKITVCAEGEAFECTTTNNKGEYTISGLPNGMYKVGFFPEEGVNYLSQYYNGKATRELADLVSVTAGTPATNINAKLVTGGQIAGKVTAASGGAALAKVTVCAFSSSGEFFGRCASTNVGGEYTIAGLPKGSEYRVEFLSFEGNYESQYYNEKTLFETPTNVTVTPPGTTSSINAKLKLAAQIAGKVTAASGGAPLEKIQVCASFGRCATTNSAGEYTISGLATGKYTVVFFPLEEAGNYLTQYWNAKSNLSEAEQVAVKAPETTSGINAALQSGGQVTGTVSAASGAGTLGHITACAYKVTGKTVEFVRCALTSAGKLPEKEKVKPKPPPPVVPNSNFSLTKAPIFNAKTGELDFFFTVANPGTFKWSLWFKNADVGFADALGLQLGATGLAQSGPASAEAAKKKKCKRGFVKHKGKCVRVLVPFGSGSKSVPAGTVEIKVHASRLALKALNAGRTLHVSGTFQFQSALGGAPVVHSVSAVVREPKKHKKKKKGH
jgi:hypothetical protein